MLASATYFTLLELSRVYLGLSVFEERDVLTGFEIGVAVGIAYLVVDFIRFRKGRTDFGK